MRRTHPYVQPDLFSMMPAPPALTSLQLQQDELVDMLSRLLWEVAQATEPSTKKASDEQDHS